MSILYKIKCARCRTNYVTVTHRERFPLCYDCQKKDLEGEIKDPKMKKLLDIPEEFYKKNRFLRSIKINCIRWGKLTEKQIEAFKKGVAKMEKGEPSEEIPEE